eukprot:2804811-Amphidinium_carterae.2
MSEQWTAPPTLLPMDKTLKAASMNHPGSTGKITHTTKAATKMCAENCFSKRAELPVDDLLLPKLVFKRFEEVDKNKFRTTSG